MIALWIATAIAANPPPDQTAVENTEVYEASWALIQDGPPGCWEVIGRASWNWDIGKRGYSRGDAAFAGRLEDGVWRDFVLRSLGEDRKEGRHTAVKVFDHEEQRFVPLVGRRKSARLDEDKDGVGDHILTAALDRLGTDVDYSWTSYDEAAEGTILHRAIPFGTGSGAPEAQMDVFFPGLQTLPTKADIAFPESFGVPGFRLAKVRDAEAHIRAKAFQGMVFPQSESFSFTVGFMGFQATGAQTVTYRTYRPCGGEVTSAAEAIVD